MTIIIYYGIPSAIKCILKGAQIILKVGRQTSALDRILNLPFSERFIVFPDI